MNDWITHLVEGGGYWGIALLMVLENVFPPIPSELIMGLGGIAVARGRMEVLPLMVAGTLGSTAGNYVWFVIGRALGYQRLRPFVDRFGRWLTMDWPAVEALVRFFERHGQWVVFAMRFSPLMRTMISLPAGLARMGQVRFVLFTLAGTAVWNAVLVWAGWKLGQDFGRVEDYTGPVALACFVVMGVWYAWRVVTWRGR
ncbi:DedA family protein [Novosphingobium sp. FKTRR1]|uniref:DedA family protein n=1 Tax=Novosphingobium sp. FKTRR1 TaxID=2879118 RepID=UPI001CF046F9|nr:DedA family protein [Novosphingobium sp. FKTRR1]